MNIAEQIINLMGGAQVVADVTGVDVSRVHRWKYDKGRGGTGGLIPARHQPVILEEAAKRRLDVRPEDFFLLRAKAPETESKIA